MKSWRTGPVTLALRAALWGMALGGAASVTTVSAAAQEFHVTAGSLAQALNQLAQQSGVLLSYDPALTVGKQSSGLQGRYEVEQGFAQLLANSGLRAERHADGSLSIVAQPVAQTAAAVPARNDQIVVTAPPNTALKLDVPVSETPRAMSVVTQQQMEERGAKKVDQALRYSPGVLASYYGPDNKAEWLSIRGFKDQSRFQNGLAAINENAYFVQQFEAFGVDRVEVLKGPASVLYGQNPPGGLVNMISKRPTRLPQGQISLDYGSNDYRQLGIDSAGPLNDDGTVLYRVVGLARGTSGEMDHAKSNRFYLAPSMTFLMGDDTELTVLASYMDTHSDVTSGFKLPYGTLHNTPFGKVGYRTSLGEPGLDRNNTRQFTLGYEFTHRINDTWTFHQNTNYNYLNMDLRTAYASYQVSEREAQRGMVYRDGFAQNWATDNRMVGEWQWGDVENTLLLGIDYRRANSQSRDGDFYGIGAIDMFNPVYGNAVLPLNDLYSHRTGRHQIGYYVQNQFRYDDRWIALIGGRYDKAKSRDQNLTDGKGSRKDDDKFTKTAGLMYLFDNGVSPYISYSESFMPLVGNDGKGNPYKPTVGKQTEVGMKYTPHGFNGYATVALYNLVQDNVSTTDPDHSGISMQTGQVRSRGIELEMSGEVARGLTVLANYNYGKVETTKSLDQAEVGKRFVEQPLQQASGWVNYAFQGTLSGLSVGTGVRYVGSSFGDSKESPNLKSPAYTLWDAMVAYDFTKDWRLQVNATNLSNREYVSVCNFWCYYGEGRVFNANLSYRW
ncbi:MULTISPECIES: TonB-dependent siderophore receptor [unclassified Symbiopectobacterium]|uniref:TonB-dependent siderophore receptor n=1 Tax=unclassified Symbiopectobacterium TaxID=2794573 RepID=UPI002226F95D|nr:MULTISPECIES: TonB-dependent siderophore receptor [unclassified Symbiopectobacterium]MCW2475177.1 TonB-dependent siderophore receptor [Candidatus Symbiopectobacterium sp. NZEC151]MCW2486645.1 TonB-dependent siderophore receptor [Candidatus Symbiopectobacterium sp. NZEC127]